MGLSRMCSRVAWRRRVAALAVVAAWCACAVRAPVTLTSRFVFERAEPAVVAHLLADFSTHPHASASRPGSWLVEEQRGNYTEWRYRVSFECGARCAGEARVHAAAAGHAHQHARVANHRVRVDLLACKRPPLLPWPQICEEMEIEWVVAAESAGSVVQEYARAWCGVGRVLVGACARDLRTHRDTHLAQLRAALHTPAL